MQQQLQPQWFPRQCRCCLMPNDLSDCSLEDSTWHWLHLAALHADARLSHLTKPIPVCAQDAELSESSSAASVGGSLGRGAQFRKASKWQGFLASLQELSWALQEVVLGSLQRLMRSPPGAILPPCIHCNLFWQDNVPLGSRASQ